MYRFLSSQDHERMREESPSLTFLGVLSALAEVEEFAVAPPLLACAKAAFSLLSPSHVFGVGGGVGGDVIPSADRGQGADRQQQQKQPDCNVDRNIVETHIVMGQRSVH